MLSGLPTSPLVDVGQIEGGLVMALGMWTSEQVQPPPPLQKKNHAIPGSVRPLQRPTPGQHNLGVQGAFCNGHPSRSPTGVVQQREEQGAGAGQQGSW